MFVVLAFIVGSAAIEVLAQAERQNQWAIAEASAGSRLTESILGREPEDTPNIYFLVYDSYVPNETMMNYGIDNSAQEGYLVERGFTLYPHT